jgi:hypothetical protein
MNISHKHKIIWWAPERCGTRAVAHIFKDHEFGNVSENGDYTTLGERYHSHDNIFPNEYSNYKLISSIRNPYDRMFSLYYNFVEQVVPFRREYFEQIKTSFNKWIDLVLKSRKLIVVVGDSDGKFEFKYRTISKWPFRETEPNSFIRMENIVEDLERLDFIKESDKWKNGEYLEFLHKNQFKNEKSIKFHDVYDTGSAKKVYEYYKKHFYLCDYDPFSFTKEELTEEQKISFIHDIAE